MELPTFEDLSEVVEEFRQLHYRLSVCMRTQSRQVMHSTLEGDGEPEEFQLLRELSRLRQDLEWHLNQSEIDRSQVGDLRPFAVRSLEAPEVHFESQPVLHTRLVSTEEVRENLMSWKVAMQQESDSLLRKGAVAEVPDSEVQSWVEAGKDAEILPGRGVPSEKPPLVQGDIPRKKNTAQ